MIKRSMVRQVLALGIALLVVGMGLSGCARRVSVSLQIVSSYSGKGVPGATVTFGGSGNAQVLTSDGTGMASGMVQADRLQLSVEATGYQKAFLQVTDLAELPPSISVVPLFLGAGTVTCGGLPVAGATVTVWNTAVTTGADGSFTMEGLAEGTYVGRVTKQGYADATFSLVVGKGAKPAKITLKEGQLLSLSSLANLSAYELTASYHRTLGGEEKTFDGRIIKNGSDLLVMSGDPANPMASLMVRGGTGYTFENGAYVVKGETAAAAARVLQETCEGLLQLPATFSPRLFTIQKQAPAQLLGQACDVWTMSGQFTFEEEPVDATATVTVGTNGVLTGIPVKIVLNARSQSFFNFTYDAVVEIVSVDQAQVAARFSLRTSPQSEGSPSAP